MLGQRDEPKSIWLQDEITLTETSSHNIRIGIGIGMRWCTLIKSHFSFQPVPHDWCTKGSGMCYPVYEMMHIKEPLLPIGKSSPCGGSGFLLLLSDAI